MTVEQSKARLDDGYAATTWEVGACRALGRPAEDRALRQARCGEDMVMERTDEELLSTLRSDPAALDAFYRRHYRTVVAFAARRCRSADEAADLVAATFLALIESAHRFDPSRGRAVAYLLGIAARQHARIARRLGRERAALQRLSGRALLEPDDYARFEEQLDAERLAPQVAAALAQLPPGQRDVIDLVAHHGLHVHEAARALGIPPASARMRLARARRAMRQAALPIRVQEETT